MREFLSVIENREYLIILLKISLTKKRIMVKDTFTKQNIR